MTLRSHPDKSLAQHVDEVGQAADAILARHSKQLREDLHLLLNLIVRYHDLGKAAVEFQLYIRSPKEYLGEKLKKAHTPLSLYWWLSHANQSKYPTVDSITVAAVVWKHHGDFPLLQDYGGLEYAIDNQQELIKEQLSTFPSDAVEQELGISLTPVNLPELDDWLEDAACDNPFGELAAPERTHARLRAQILFSILLQSDRAFLALTDTHRQAFLKPGAASLPSPDSVAVFCAGKPQTALSEYQSKVRQETVAASAGQRLATVSLPTGMGKTMLGAQWVLQCQNEAATKGKIIIVLPFLSVIEQTANEYSSLFGTQKEHIQQAHSLATIDYLKQSDDAEWNDAEEEKRLIENQAREFLTDIWDAPVIITTFDQFLYALFSEKKQHILKAHNLADACVVMDEIQAVPPKLWRPLSEAMSSLTKDFGTRFLVMSATQPGFLQGATEVVPHAEEHFANRRRYEVHLLHQENTSLDAFCESIGNRLVEEWVGKRVMFVLNTRGSARQLRDFIETLADDRPLYFISADVVPRSRLRIIAEVKMDKPCIVVATQCVEAGVDIDMEVVIRDWAPLDSIIQVAGRCNRRARRDRGNVSLVKLTAPNGRTFAEMVYDNILLDVTGEVFSGMDVFKEEDVYPLIQSYYQRIRTRKDQGDALFESWSKWEKHIPVRRLLRGDGDKFEFIIPSQDTDTPLLRESLEAALQIEDRWERKRAIRQLGSRIAPITVSIWARRGLQPEDVADQVGFWWLLRPQYYHEEKGFLHENLPSQQGSMFI